MAPQLQYRAGMRTLTVSLLLALMVLAVRPAHAQDTPPPDGARITSVQVSGLELSRLSQGLQDDIKQLTGSPLDRQQLRTLASRIESELPRMVAATRVTADGTGGAHVAFVVARMREGEQGNVNEKYIIADAQITGIPDRAITPDVRADLTALKGKPLDADLAERLETRLRSMFPEYEVNRVTSRGDETGQLKLVFALHRTEWSQWLSFEPLKSSATYHSDQGWGAYFDLPIGTRNVRVAPIIALSSKDDLIEETSGWGVRLEARTLGTERLGASFEGTWFNQDWQNSTLAALALDPTIPGPYDERATFTPMLNVAL